MQTKEHQGGISDFLKRRSQFIELLMVAVILALGVNLASGGIAEIYRDSPRVILSVGVVLMVACLCAVVSRGWTSTERSVSLTGCLLFRGRTDEQVAVPGYELSESICRFFSWAFKENSALKVQWDLGRPHLQITDKRSEASGEARRLLEEAVEYWVLKACADHLSTYFARYKGHPQVAALKREQIPDVLLSNRFLELFSRPMKERAAFVPKTEEERRFQEESERLAAGEDGEPAFTAAWNFGGEYYEYFRMVLPKGTRVTRDGSGCVCIVTPRLTIRISIKVDGRTEELPTRFLQWYVGESARDVYCARRVTIRLSAKIHASGAFRSGGWEFYEWYDSFVESLQAGAEFKSFLTRLGWQSAYTATIAKENSTKNRDR